MVSRKSKRGDYELEELDNVELSPEIDAQISQITASAEAEIAATRVNFRWEKQPLDLVKKVAETMGIPYQTYMKQAIYRQAIEDLSKMEYAQLHRGAHFLPESRGLTYSGTERLITTLAPTLSLGSITVLGHSITPTRSGFERTKRETFVDAFLPWNVSF
jgi:predicted DNA binding CopG/RHH family protein